MYACSPGEFSYELGGGSPEAGGIYAQSLISAAIEWAKQQQPQIRPLLSVVAAHRLAKQRVENAQEADQTPSISYPKAEPHYPFCIVA